MSNPNLNTNKENLQSADKEFENKIRERLIVLTKKIAAQCSDHYRIQNIWDMEMVFILMDRPDGCNKAINLFHSAYRKKFQGDLISQ